jgi:hypothetical protein
MTLKMMPYVVECSGVLMLFCRRVLKVSVGEALTYCARNRITELKLSEKFWPGLLLPANVSAFSPCGEDSNDHVSR